MVSVLWFKPSLSELEGKGHITRKSNVEVRAISQQAIGPHEDLLTTVKKRKLHWHVMSPVYYVWQNKSCKHSKMGKKTRQTEEEVGRQHQGMGRSGVRQVPEGGGEQGKMEDTDCEIICGAPTTIAARG